MPDLNDENARLKSLVRWTEYTMRTLHPLPVALKSALYDLQTAMKTHDIDPL